MSRVRITHSIRWLFVVALVTTAFAALAGSTSAHGRDDDHNQGAAGQVYTITNETAVNRIAVFDRAGNGRLHLDGYVESGGQGTGTGLGSQGAIILSNDGRWLFAVNAGSDSISSFRVTGHGLSLVDTIASGGTMPVSLTLNDDLLYVLNAGGTPNISGFRLDNHGELHAIGGSTQSTSSTTPVQVGFSPDGRVLVVAGKGSNTLDSFVVNHNGVAGPAQTFASNAGVPYGFAFDSRGHLIVSEASGFVTPYAVSHDGTISPITDAQPTNQAAACWLVITGNGRFTYTANAASHSITGYSIGHDGSLSILNSDGITADTGAGTHPIDMALSNNSQFLYVNNGVGGIGAFAVHADGSLSSIDGVSGLPASTTGLASK